MSEHPIAFNTQSIDELSQLVVRMDPELTFVKDLHPEGTTCRTLLVSKDDKLCSLKIRRLSNNVWDETYFYFEIHALRRVKERHITGTTALINEYKDDRYHALLKTFAEGTPCNKLDVDELLTNREFIKELDALYLKLHLAGIARINFLPRKLVITEQGSIVLVDLSSCIVNTESGIQLFSQAMREDSRFITKLERHTTH